MLHEYGECRVKRTLVTVNLVSRRLVINRRWRGIDRYLLTVDDSTVSRVDTYYVSSMDLSSPAREISLGGALTSGCSRVWASFRLINERLWSSPSPSLFLPHLAIRREAWRGDR